MILTFISSFFYFLFCKDVITLKYLSTALKRIGKNLSIAPCFLTRFLLYYCVIVQNSNDKKGNNDG